MDPGSPAAMSSFYIEIGAPEAIDRSCWRGAFPGLPDLPGTFRGVTGRLRAVDLFAGAGGLSLGLGAAGFRVATAVESDPQAAATYAASHPTTLLVEKDVTAVTGADLTRRLRSRPDLVSGGPPCQGFSIKGQRRTDHPGNAMIGQVARLVGEMQPRAVLIENVVGLKSLAGGWYFDRLVTGLERIPLLGGGRYTVDFQVLNAAHYGTPQQRRRLFIVAVEPGVDFAWPEPTTAVGDLTLWDAIGDLPPAAAQVGATVRYPARSAVPLYASQLRDGAPVVSNHHTKRVEERRQRRYASLQQGQDRTHLPEDLAAGGHESKYRRLRANAPSPTLTAHMSKDLSDFIHPRQDRSLTLREAARVQGFPDTVQFLGSQASQFRQVGNAVPVPLAEALGRALAKALRRAADAPVAEAIELDGRRPPALAAVPDGAAATA